MAVTYASFVERFPGFDEANGGPEQAYVERHIADALTFIDLSRWPSQELADQYQAYLAARNMIRDPFGSRRAAVDPSVAAQAYEEHLQWLLDSNPLITPTVVRTSATPDPL